MIQKGDYSIRDIKGFFKREFVLGDVIETVLKHPEGTYLKVGFKVLQFVEDGILCLVLYEMSKRDGQSVFHKNQKKFIHKDHFKYFYIP